VKKILSVIGARPQFIKAGPLSQEMRKYFKEVLVHTGQHYDYGMSDIFFTELSIPEPDYNLGVGAVSQGKMTGDMLSKLEDVILTEKPDIVLIYGDTNSTLAGALAAVKLHIPIAHVEAGLRSYNRSMPEEINRVLSDQVSTWLFVPSKVAKNNLEKEGIKEGVYEVGDIMFDVLLANSKKATDTSDVLKTNGLSSKNYFVATIHRAENTDEKDKLVRIFDIFASLNEKIILPIHPRTRNKIVSFGLTVPKNISAIEPLGYLDMLELMQNAKAIFTDSGGIQKEAYYLKVPCITLREESEWIETVEVGWNFIVGSDKVKFTNAFQQLDKVKSKEHPFLYGDGTTAEKIVNILREHFKL
jgi:UDP-N-acetylglucosamine 2-epimerase